MQDYEKFLFHSDELEGTYEGYTRGVTWKGHECPCFSKETSEKIIKDFIIVNGDTNVFSMYDSKKDRFIIIKYSNLSLEKIEQLKDTNTLLKLHTAELSNIYDANVFEKDIIFFKEELKVIYEIGSYCWIWEKK